MRELKKLRHITVKAETPEEFDRRINTIMEEASDVELKTHDVVPYLAYIRCTYYILEPEDICDEYELKGEVHYCSECKYLDLSKKRNSRQLIYPCPYSKYGKVYSTSRACAIFYEEMEEEHKRTEEE